jgi:uncharacterized protein
VKDPSEVVKVHQKVQVTVLEVDLARKRISLTMKRDPEKIESASKRSEGKPERSNARPQDRRQQKPLAGGFGGGWFSKALERSKTDKRH